MSIPQRPTTQELFDYIASELEKQGGPSQGVNKTCAFSSGYWIGFEEKK